MNRLGAIAFLALASLAAPAYAADCHLAVEANDLMQFNQKSLEVPSNCTEVELTLKHVGHQNAQVMGHNWVLARASDLMAVAIAGQNAGRGKNFQAPGDKRILAATSIVGGGETTQVTFSAASLKAGETYAFFCTTPGHSAIMRGSLVLGGARQADVAAPKDVKHDGKAAAPVAAANEAT